ncbi:hypothetical protein WMO23_05905 [Megasphaera sp. CLA-AA-H81]|uniref:30S ribosomal protein S20 n=1 Tax=Megasphaera intestinihominis TaxID=3133159 RepID=A0ABV1CWX9_9FIRM|nr:MAG TPA: hypothetical protein [Caudoviricetes sp.]
MATTTSDIQKRINRTTGVNRRKVNTASRRQAVRNTYRRKSNGGQGG